MHFIVHFGFPFILISFDFLSFCVGRSFHGKRLIFEISHSCCIFYGWLLSLVHLRIGSHSISAVIRIALHPNTIRIKEKHRPPNTKFENTIDPMHKQQAHIIRVRSCICRFTNSAFSTSSPSLFYILSNHSLEYYRDEAGYWPMPYTMMQTQLIFPKYFFFFLFFLVTFDIHIEEWRVCVCMFHLQFTPCAQISNMLQNTNLMKKKIDYKTGLGKKAILLTRITKWQAHTEKTNENKTKSGSFRAKCTSTHWLW